MSPDPRLEAGPQPCHRSINTVSTTNVTTYWGSRHRRRVGGGEANPMNWEQLGCRVIKATGGEVDGCEIWEFLGSQS